MAKSFFNKLKYHLTKKSVIIVGFAIIGLSIASYCGVTNLRQPSHQHEILQTAPEDITGRIITLRRLREEYFIEFHNVFSNIVREQMEFPKDINLTWTIRMLQSDMKRDQFHGKTMLFYCIFDNKDKKIIGEVNIRDKNPNDVGQIGIWINENYWGGGRFQEAIRLISETYFLLHPNERDYIAHIRLWNQRSFHAFKKFGFKQIGYFYEQGEKTRYIMQLDREQVLGKKNN
jgi:RimJ/RimL family protein N-acetyltransferase